MLLHGDRCLLCVTQHPYLGILFDSFSPHINGVTSKATRMLKEIFINVLQKLREIVEIVQAAWWVKSSVLSRLSILQYLTLQHWRYSYIKTNNYYFTTWFICISASYTTIVQYFATTTYPTCHHHSLCYEAPFAWILIIISLAFLRSKQSFY